jgi:hypothetical protein
MGWQDDPIADAAPAGAAYGEGDGFQLAPPIQAGPALEPPAPKPTWRRWLQAAARTIGTPRDYFR